MSLFYVMVGFVLPAAIHAYVWARWVRAPRWPPRVQRALTIAMVVMFVSVPFTTHARLYAPGLAKALGWWTLPWLAFMGLCAVITGAVDIARLVERGIARARRRPIVTEGITRRRFLAGATTTVAGASMASGIVSARGDHEIVDVEVKLAKLPKSLDGFSIVQLSDLHIGMTIDRAFVERVVERANRLSPDLVALTGDLVDGPVDRLADDAAPLADLRAKHGVYAITGNHEFYAGADPWVAHLSTLGARYLRNARVAIGDGDDVFDLAGVEDLSGRSYGHRSNMIRALAGRDPARALVMLAHQPRMAHRASELGVDLQLSGHTHGGQIWPWHYAVKIQQRGLLAGRYQIGETQLYVTRGCGYWGPPVRLFAPLEITRIILRAA